MTRTRQARWTVSYTDDAGNERADEILALDAAQAAEHARTHIAGVGRITVTGVGPAAPRPRKARKVADGFDAWAAANGEPATTNVDVDGYEALGLGTDGAPMFETIAEFAFAVEVAAGPAAGRLFA